ncbi:MAG: ATP-binding protein [Candidatus Marinimicrobia bacterium]|nr:ATP-binding protein [Candidatus Neomarinimicrobiota bacterium]
MKQRLKESPVVAILGPRQCGKTTLSRQFAMGLPSKKIHFFDLEDPRHLSRLDTPTLALEGLEGFIIIDEVQRKPELFSILRVLVDKHPSPRYVILGSASRDLIAQSSETLAGRISYIEMSGFLLEHLAGVDVKKLWIRGGFPRSFLAKNENSSFQWRRDFVTTFLERDIPNLGINIPARTLRRFWIMLAHYHGQIFNASEIGRSLRTSDNTARRYLDLLSGVFLVRQLQPWYYNTKKRLVKRPKIYFRDSGILHALLSLDSYDNVVTHPKLGASWEGFALEQVINYLNLREEECFFWAVHTGAELDLVFLKKGKLWGIEIKYDEAPRLTKSMKTAISELSLAHLWIVYPGEDDYRLHEKATVISIKNLKAFNL